VTKTDLSIALYFQAIQGVSAVQAGIKLLPLLISVVITSVGTGGLITVVGYYNPFILPSMILFCVGSAMLSTLSLISPTNEWFGYQVICGLGIGVGFQTGVLVVQNVIPLDWIPVATAAVQFFQSMGGAIFIAVAQSLFQNGLANEIEKNAPGLRPEIFINSGVSQVRQILAQLRAEQFTDAVLTAYLVGLRHTYYMATALAGMAFIVSGFLSWKKIKKHGSSATPSGGSDAEEDVEKRAAHGTTAEKMISEGKGEIDGRKSESRT